MASFDEIGNGSINFGEVIKDVAIDSLSTLARGLIVEMLSANIGNFNLLNYDFMNIHMMRNAYEKSITLNVVGENAYTNGNSDLTATPAQHPSYTNGNNYMEFITNTRNAEQNGTLTTRVSDKNGNVTNLYLDTDSDEINEKVEFTGSIVDKNSILYKTKKLIRQNKLKTIVSQFHTEGVEYNGQIGSEFGESHGRNLLTKDAENGGTGYSINGYNNPYCRVWTHHYKYDKLSKTMRANSDKLNTWGGFEWEDTDKGHGKDDSKYGDGEKKYDYAWRGKHNQDRRKENSVLDTKTGLVKITPQYRNGGKKDNRHTKECMFSIENLAWKDYDPYSFERALSWEQRGPFGGRIMWFPPYGIEITETSSARWNTNEFIGRGEPVYTYVNSERSGNLSFMMITDHPSSIDYASWWDDNNMIKNADNGDGNSENDYLRYFAGCANGDNEPGDSGNRKPGKTGGLIVKPTPLTDEYLQENPAPLVKTEKIKAITKPSKDEPVVDKHPETVEFFVFFPNNYSGVMDAPTKQDASVNAIAYLLGGIDAQKKDGVDASLSINSVFSYVGDKYIGYEMVKGTGITTSSVIEDKQYIQGGKLNTKEYVPEDWKKWCYRIDHLQPYTVGDHNGTNTINQSVLPVNLKDTKTNRTNFDVSSNSRVQEMAENKNNLYSFAEVAAALYSEKMMDVPFLYNYLIDCGVNQDRVNKLIDIFSSKDRKLDSIKCTGIASSHGSTSRNTPLSNNRAKTVINWLHTYSEWQNVENIAKPEDNKIKEVDKKDAKNVNGDSAKLYRCAHCVMKFSSGLNTTNKPKDNETVIETKDLVGFKWVDAKPQPDGSIWNYYQRDNSVKYFEQEAKSVDNYENPKKGYTTITEDQVFQIFENYPPLRLVDDSGIYTYFYYWELCALVDKAANVLSFDRGTMVDLISGGGDYIFDEDSTYSFIWKYGNPDNMHLNDINEGTNLIAHVQQNNVTLTIDETNYIGLLRNKEVLNISDNDLKIFIGLHKALDSIKYIKDSQGTRIAGSETVKSVDEMKEKTTRRDESLTEGCEDSLWIDRGDGLLIQECNLNRSDAISRFDPSTGKGDWNKLRYDQEYHFYKQWITEHPLMYEKLQEKIKYFNPAFHSMTPEGFNARCTFLQQCTRQGNTKTMSDLGGKTANNLAFGRPPYCVLRLGDFYYQMIIIENVTFDFNVSEGIQWDLNTEGNGVQPMLCKVNISFKFIGGGDITGPVQRLQNAMSFNYYANASFYDNRADRVQYQPTNWATMGGAGNNEMDLSKSYAYVTQLYEEKEPNIVKPSK